MKIVINSSYGAFRLSDEAHALYAKLKGYKLIKKGNDVYRDFYKNEEIEENLIDEWALDRSDPDLVKVVETLGEKSNHGKRCKLKVVEIPDDVKWYIESTECGGEFASECHRTWK